MPKSKVRKRSSAPRRDDNARCCYCGRPTSAPRKQPYVSTDYEPTDQPEAPAGARWPHSPRPTEPPPLCREAEKGRAAQRKVRWT